METNNEVKTAKYHFKSIPGNAQLNIYYDPETTNEDYFVNAVNNYDKLKEDNEVLLNALKSVQNIVSFLINTTPTGDNRNRLTHVNILSLEAIRQVESKIKISHLKKYNHGKESI